MRRSATLSLGLVVLVLIATPWIASQGTIQGVAFSPRSWNRRAFTLFQIPVLRWQVGRVQYSPLPDDLVSYLSTQSWWPASSLDYDDYHVMSAAGGGRFWEGDAEILSEFLGVDPLDGPSPWLCWSREHPELASSLWPAVFQVVSEGRYDVVPGLFEAALCAGSSDALTQSLCEIMAEDKP